MFKKAGKKSRVIGIFIILFLVFSVFLVSSSENNEKISKEVYNSFEKNSEDVRIIINLKEPVQEKGFLMKLVSIKEETTSKEEVINTVREENIKHIFENSIAVEVSESELESLKENINVESVIIDRPVHTFLQDSVPLINATGAWPIQIYGTNLTGLNETICIIDTGIDFTHPDLIGKNKTCVIDCQGASDDVTNCVENCSLGDDNGHGTHCAGIAAANGTIKGVAIGANLIGVKALDSSGSGYVSDIKTGIEWCINNAQAYNISVISISSGVTYENGTGVPYTNYCDDIYDNSPEIDFLTPINNATAHNISVIIATGNDGYTEAISAPACITNATAVGATDKLDVIASYSNRNNLIDLIAPGGVAANPINSTSNDNSYIGYYGTSMATPHVAGAFAIIRQLYRLQEGRVPTPQEIKDIFNSTGKQINDTAGTGLNFSRIDIYAAVNSILKNVIVTLYPENNSYLNLMNQNQTFICNSTSLNSNLKNITFYLWNSTNNLVYNLTINISGTNNQTNFSYNFTNENKFYWNCIAYNNNSFFNSNVNYTITYDISTTNISSISAGSITSTSASISWITNESTNSSVNYGTTINLGSIVGNSSLSTSNSVYLSDLSASTLYYYNVTSCDPANNCNTTGPNNFTTSATVTVSNDDGDGGSSGGGGGSTTSTYVVNSEQISAGYSQTLNLNDRIKFSFPENKTELHFLTLTKISTGIAEILIQSTPIKLTLLTGQEKKINLSSADYYDLYIRLNSTASTKASIYIKTIHEEIPRLAPIINNSEGNNSKTSEIEGDKNNTKFNLTKIQKIGIYIFIGIFIIIIVYLLLIRARIKHRNKK
ncbi:MAG: S8 family serine peptidase [Candidatus Pacearchaeota archaeon]|jgi:subtilisin family serine protease